jgi:60 kDa SS-A/Ro ribonucleoprotein
MVATYKEALSVQREKDKGLTITHQGGVAYAISEPLKQLRRFLILGSEGGSFYVSQKELTDLNVKSVRAALDADPFKAIDLIVDVSNRALAPKNEPAILALALAASYKGSDEAHSVKVRNYALSKTKLVCRTGTHLFHFAEYCNQLRGWGRGLRRAIGQWYTDRSPLSLAQQVTKYQQRDGWSHADLLRLSHPQAQNETQNAIFKYVVDKELPHAVSSDYLAQQFAVEYLHAVEHVKNTTSRAEILQLISKYQLPREVLPTQALNDADVWEALLYAGDGMPFTAMLRNLGTMSKVGLLTQGSDAARFVMKRLRDEDAIRKARIHPVDVLKAQMVYKTGKGVRGDATWQPVYSIVQTLEPAFYLAFGNVEPTGKRLLLAIDVSGSMTTYERGYNSFGLTTQVQGLAGVPALSPRIAAAVCAMVTARVEDDYEILGFSHQLIDLKISGNDSLEDAMKKCQAPFGGTDISLPMRYALDNKRKFDAFAVYTDNENGSRMNPAECLRRYRSQSGIHDAKLVVNAMIANHFSVADPTDRNMLDVVGFDTSAPQVMSAFIRGEV